MSDKKKERIIAIHQPDFMPWMGFFYKACLCDEFVLLDHVSMDVKNAGWIKRVKFLLSSGPDWCSVPLKRPETGHMQAINEIEVDTGNKVFEKTKRQIVEAYRKHPFFYEVRPLLDNYFNNAEVSLHKKNKDFICSIFKALEINCNIVYSTDLKVSGKNNDMNAGITVMRSGTAYLSGMGADSYQKEETFTSLGLQLKVTNFDPMNFTYPQQRQDSFVSGLSIVDVVANIGFENCKQVLKPACVFKTQLQDLSRAN